jgi:hypothetical protein
MTTYQAHYSGFLLLRSLKIIPRRDFLVLALGNMTKPAGMITEIIRDRGPFP